MTISAKVILDSVSPLEVRLTTLELEYPRFIHSEFMTHRVFSRNASSSRAIPFAKLRRLLLADPACPVHWGRNRPGMQAIHELPRARKAVAKALWFGAMYGAVGFASVLNWLGVHKQIVNRVIEPWSHIRVIVSSTDWANFLALRDHPDAQPEIQALARAVKAALAGSTPTRLEAGEWHLPYITVADRVVRRSRVAPPNDELCWGENWELLRKMSAARCARVSYLTHDGRTPFIEEDLELFERLAGSFPIHASPMEHQATPDTIRSGNDCRPLEYRDWRSRREWGNFFGWRQHRRMVPGNTVRDKRAA